MAENTTAVPKLTREEKQTREHSIIRQVRENCPDDLARLRAEIKPLRHQIIVEYVLSKLPLQPCFNILQAIWFCLREAHPDPHAATTETGIKIEEKTSATTISTHPKQPNWPEIVCLAAEHASLFPSGNYMSSEEGLRSSESRSFAVADAAHDLRVGGYQCTLTDGIVIFAETERQRMVRDMEEMIRALGAYDFVDILCDYLGRHRSQRMQRYLRYGKTAFSTKPKSSSLPVNFLLQLAVKQIQWPGGGTARDLPGLLTRLCDLATRFAALYDVEPHAHWDLMFVDVHGIRNYLTDLVFHDRLFHPRQLRSSDVPKILRGLFDWVLPALESSLGWRLAEAAQMAEDLLDLAKPTGPTLLLKRVLDAKFKDLDAARRQKLLDVFTHPKNPNPHLSLPEQALATQTGRPPITFPAKPLIHLGGGDLVLADRAICSPAFYEAVAAALRLHDQDTNKHIGLAAERFLIQEFQACGVPVACGNYLLPAVNGMNGKKGWPRTEGDCDAVIETANTLFLLELKAKPLTSPAQSGSDVDLYLDLSKSLLKALSQACKHEIALRQRGSIQLTHKDGPLMVIEHCGRRVEKIAVTLLDYGRLQDRTMLEKMTLLIHSRLSPIDDQYNAVFDELNKLTATLRAQIATLAELDPEGAPHFFYHCWFLSLPQLLILLDDVRSAEDFAARLDLTRSLTTGSMDWYTEMDYALTLRHLNQQS